MSFFSIGDLEILLRLIMAAVLCGVIGLEYKGRNKTASVRTSALIGMGVAIFTIVSIGLNEAEANGVAGYAVAAIGLIGLGAIMQSRSIVKGLTTAASIWVAAAIGMVIGMGMYGMAVMAVVLTIIILTILRNIDSEEEKMPR